MGRRRNGARFGRGNNISTRWIGPRTFERLNDVAETSGLRERCALGADDDDVEAVEIAFRLHGDAGAGAASRGLDDVENGKRG